MRKGAGSSKAPSENKDSQPAATPPTGPDVSTKDPTADSSRPYKNNTSSMSNRQSGSLVGGSWRGKASPVAGIAKESASAGVSIAPDVQTTTPAASKRLSRLGTPSKSSPSAASMSKINAVPDSHSAATEEQVSRETQSEDRVFEVASIEEKSGKNSGDLERPIPAPGWRGWWTGSSAISQEETNPSERTAEFLGNNAQEQAPKNGPKDPGVDVNKLNLVINENYENVEPEQSDAADQEVQRKASQPQRSSWFGLWGSGLTSLPSEQATQGPAPKAESVEPSHSKVDAVPEPASPSQQTAKEVTQRSSSGSWAFWSRQRSPNEKSDPADEKGRQEYGELAVADTPSQAHPQPAKAPGMESLGKQQSKKRPRPASASASQDQTSKTSAQIDTKQQSSKEQDVDSDDMAHMSQSVLRTTVERKEKRLSSSKHTNLLLPLFNDTGYQIEHAPSYWDSISRVLGRHGVQEVRQVSKLASPHKVKRAVAIGIHGYFPAALIQKVVGQPTGTSIRFADGAAEAIRKWATLHGYSPEIEKVALEGEGMIANRVDTLWKLLLNWIGSLRKADFILVACHSQGVPVAVSLVARLLNFGCLSNNARVGIAAMAGVNLGPFPAYQSRYFGGSASELFEFGNSSSNVSKEYSSALAHVLKNHVRITYIGSIDDQLVSMESSTFSSATHPYIYRAVFVDGRNHLPDFLTHLVGFALKLRNLGISDHGLIRELSGPLAGSLYTGEGHSRIHEDPTVYDLAVQHSLETADVPEQHLPAADIKQYEPSNSTNSNPYFLPWAMRGLLEEDFVRHQLNEETDKLLGLFNDWKPQSKNFKDVKWRLEAVQSKL